MNVDCGDVVKIETRCRIPIWRTFGRIPWHVIPKPHATLQGVIIPSAILNIVFRHYCIFLFFNAVWALTSGGFRIVSDSLVLITIMSNKNKMSQINVIRPCRSFSLGEYTARFHRHSRSGDLVKIHGRYTACI